jgi:hypothetical protein
MKIAALTSLIFLAALPICAATIGFESSELPGLAAGYGPDPYFSGTVKGDSVTNQYAGLGVVMSMSANGVTFLSDSSCYGTYGGYDMSGQYLMVNTVPELSQPAAQLTISFFLPTDLSHIATASGDTISLFVRDTEWATNSVRVETFGVEGDLIESWDLASLGFTKVFTTGAVQKIVITDLGSDGFRLDNLSFGPLTNPDPTPEPGTALLLAAGLAASALIFRSKIS